MRMLMLFGLVVVAAGAQQLDLSSLDKLEAVAKESSTVNLDEARLKAGRDLLSDNKVEADAKKIANSLKGVFVRSFEFDKKGAYTQADLDPVRKQLKSKGWANIITHRETDELNEVWTFNSSDGAIQAMAVIAAEERELTVVNIVGPLDASALSGLGNLGRLGEILGNATSRSSGKSIEKKDDE